MVEQALETAGLMLGTDKSRGSRLEMICADLLAGANLQEGNADIRMFSMGRLFSVLPNAQQKEFLEEIGRATC